jgi:hypothetical protein
MPSLIQFPPDFKPTIANYSIIIATIGSNQVETVQSRERQMIALAMLASGAM